MASSTKARNLNKTTARDLQAQIERLQAELAELLQRSPEPPPPTGAGRAPRARLSRPAIKGRKLAAAEDYGVSEAQLKRAVQILHDQAEQDAKEGRVVRYKGRGHLAKLLGH